MDKNQRKAKEAEVMAGVCYRPQKKKWVTQEDYKDVMRLCRKKIKRDKAQLELNLSTSVQDKNCVYECINKKTKENLSCMQSETVMRDEKKAEVLHTFFVLVFNSKTSYSLCTQSPEVVDRDGEQNKALIHNP